MPEGALPNLIIIGAMKCATSSLHRYLGLHPSIAMSRRKELKFFSSSTEWAKGVEWYRSGFDPSARVRREASPGYTNYPHQSGVPERMHGLIPRARLIYLVRDPLDRLKAHYLHDVAAGERPLGITEALEVDERSAMVTRSLYAYQLEQYLPFYPMNQILVVQQEKLLNRRNQELERIFRFLGVEPEFRSLLFHYRHHRSSRKRLLTDTGAKLSRLPGLRSMHRLPDPIRWPLEDLIYWPLSKTIPTPALPEALETHLLEKFRVDVSRLREMTGMEFEGWRV